MAQAIAVSYSGAATSLWAGPRCVISIVSVSTPHMVSGGSPMTTMRDWRNAAKSALALAWASVRASNRGRNASGTDIAPSGGDEAISCPCSCPFRLSMVMASPLAVDLVPFHTDAEEGGGAHRGQNRRRQLPPWLDHPSAGEVASSPQPGPDRDSTNLIPCRYGSPCGRATRNSVARAKDGLAVERASVQRCLDGVGYVGGRGSLVTQGDGANQRHTQTQRTRHRPTEDGVNNQVAVVAVGVVQHPRRRRGGDGGDGSD